MAQEFNRRVYQSKNWKHLIADRGNVASYMHVPIKLDDGRVVPDGMCERCFERGYLVPAEIIHHREHLTPANANDPEVAYGFDNLQRVCRKCHGELHGKKQQRSRMTFDELGNIVWNDDADDPFGGMGLPYV